MESKPTYTPEEKLRWEIEKLQAETKNLKRPWIGNPASWFTIITTVAALTTVVIQCTKSSNEFERIEIKTEQLKLERTQIETQIANIRKQTEQLKKARQVIVSQIAQANVEFSRLDNLIKVTRIRTDSTLTRPTDNQFQESKDVLTTISAALQNPASSAQFVSVIATLRTYERAVDRARGIKEAGKISYPINVYQKAAGQYVLTLGDKVTYADASSRVEYAKQNNYPDAVVRLAKNWGENLNK